MKFALRTLRKSPSFTVLAIATIAAAVAITVGNFVFDGTLLLQSTPVPQSERLAMIFRSSAQTPQAQISPADFADLSKESGSFAALGCYTGESPVLEDPQLPAENLGTQAVSGAFFQVFSVPPLLGRVIDEHDQRPGADAVLVLSERFWRSRFNADPGVIGRALRVDGRPATVIGVMPASFDLPLLWGEVDAWQPLAFNARSWSNRSDYELRLVGRLRPGVSLRLAQAEADTIAHRLAKDYPEYDGQSTFQVVSWNVMRQGGARTHEMLVMLLALGGFVLLIAGANLANLCLARSADKLHEYAIRFALGSPLGAVLRQALVEGGLIAAAGGVLGWAGAEAIVVALRRNFLVTSSRVALVDFHFDGRAWAILAGVLALSVIIQTAAPWLLIARSGALAPLQSGGRTATISRSGQRLRHALVATEVGLALVLVAGAGFFVRAVARISGQDLGWRPDGVLTASLVLPLRPPYLSKQGRDSFIRRLEPELTQLPGVQSVAISHQTPIFGYWSRKKIAIVGRPAPEPGGEPFGYDVSATPDYFATYGIRLLRGRLFSAHDQRQAPPVALIDDAMARTFWPNANPIGQRFRYTEDTDQPEVTIVGVVAEAHSVFDAIIPPATHFQIYRPWLQASGRWMTIGLRCSGAPEALENTLRNTLFRLDPALPISGIWPMRLEIDTVVGAEVGLVAKILGVFSVAGLFLAAIGVYGVVTTFVVQRTPEIGIRMALGASAGQVARLVVGRTLAVAAAGAAAGGLGAIAMLRVLGSLWPAVEGSTGTLIAGIAILMTTGAVAAFVPVRRAIRVDPMVALRAD